jgi:predicted RNase H-like HicB family nuclease
MTQRFLVMYGHTADASGDTFAWGGISPDLPGCVSVGDTLDEMRAMMKEAVEGHLQTMALPSATTIDFAEETPENGVDYCVVEYLEVQLPVSVAFPSSAALKAPQTAFPTSPMSAHDQGHHG